MKNRAKSKNQGLALHMPNRLREGIFLLTLAGALFLLVSLFTFHNTDPGWSNTGLSIAVDNWGGRVGAFIADIFLSLFGLVSYVFPCLIVLLCWVHLRSELPSDDNKPYDWLIAIFGWISFILSACALASFYLPSQLPAHAGGIIGDILDQVLFHLFNKTGSTLLLSTFLLCGITLLSGLSWLGLLYKMYHALHHVWHVYFKKSVVMQTVPTKVIPNDPLPFLERPTPIKNIAVAPVLISQKETKRLTKKMEVDLDPSLKLAPGTLPPFSLLNPSPPMNEKPFAHVSFEELSSLVEQRLLDFAVQVKVVAVHPGPIVTRFELELAPGIKVSKITGLAKDIARSLSVVSVRVVEVIPGKSVIGLEIPNENRELVTLRDILESQRYNQSRSPVSLVLGKDISGNPVVVDLTKMPHLLVAGTTGSGKSVSLNAMLLSMLFKATPDQLRLILIDPKMLELSIYDGIPHLLTPVITDMKDAQNALRWCVAEMDRRYKFMSALGVRNIGSFNQKVNEAIKQGHPIPMPSALVTDEETAKEYLKPFPLIVVIADELADMMMVVGKKVEDLIARIAQKARAAGIHLILATQRPSVDVITGLIKANIPTRVAFQVSSRIDSRTILDQQGAEQLLGHGDMLYLPPGVGVPVRVHGAYVADDEVHRIVAVWRSYGQPDYLQAITEETGGNGGNEGQGTGEQDPLYDEAVRVVVESRRASISLVQRRLRIGYNRAARMMEEMELAGVVSSVDTNGSREVLAPSMVSD